MTFLNRLTNTLPPVPQFTTTTGLWLRKISLINCHSNQSRVTRNKTKSQRNNSPSPNLSLFPGLNFTPDFLNLLTLISKRGCSQFIAFVSATSSSSGQGLLTFFPCSCVEVLCELLQHEPFSQPAVLQKLLQQGSLLWCTWEKLLAASQKSFPCSNLHSTTWHNHSFNHYVRRCGLVG